jgi:hypothetical protein
MPFGYLDTQHIDFPPGVDTAYLAGLENRAGVSFQTVLQMIDEMLGAYNGSLDPLIASMITPTEEVWADTSGPMAFEVSERGEYTIARPQLVEGLAHMLPLRGYDVSLGFTEDGLEAMSLNAIRRNVESVILGYRRLQKIQALTRLFGNTEVRVAAKTATTSPGMAGSGTGNNVFSRAYPDGTALPGGYSHYYFANTSNAGEFETTLNNAIDRLAKWNPAPFDMIGSSAMVTLVRALTGFTKVGSALVRQGVDESEALVDAAQYVGVYTTPSGHDVRVRKALEETTSPNLAIYKSYGQLDPMNPLAWRYDPIKGRNAFVRYRSLFPLDQAVVLQDFGIGVNNRTAAVLVYAANGAASYTNPTWT